MDLGRKSLMYICTRKSNEKALDWSTMKKIREFPRFPDRRKINAKLFDCTHQAQK